MEDATEGESTAPPNKTKRRAPLRLRDLQTAGQSGGWMWMEKEAIAWVLLRASITEAGLVLSTYAALCRLSSDRGNAGSVTTGMTLVAKQAGCSRRTVVRTLKELERLKLVAVRRERRGNRNDENTYFLLACGSVRRARTLVTEGHERSATQSPGVLSESEVFGGTELK